MAFRIDSLFYDKLERKLYGFGSNDYYQLGNSNNKQLAVPTEIPFFTDKKIKDISVGNWFSMVLFEDGEIYGMGSNNRNQLLADKSRDVKDPTKIQLPSGTKTKPVSLRLGEYLSLVQTETEFVYFGSYGSQILNVPGTPLACAAGSENALLLTTKGLFGIGPNGVLIGLDKLTTAESSPTLIPFFKNKQILAITLGTSHALVLASDGLYCNHLPSFKKLSVFDDHQVYGISAGNAHALIWTNHGLYGIGLNDAGALGISDPNLQKELFEPYKIPFFDTQEILSISAGWYFSIVVCKSAIFSFGYNGPRLGLNISHHVFTPTPLPIEKVDPANVLFCDESAILGRPDLLFLLLCARKFSPLCVFYHENLPLDLFKLITQQHANLGHFIPKRKEL